MDSNVASFADEIKIYKYIKSPSNAESLQGDLRSLEKRAEASSLILSENNCIFQRITTFYSVKNKALPTPPKK